VAIDFVSCEYFIIVATQFLCGNFGLAMLYGPQEGEQEKEKEQKKMMKEMRMNKETTEEVDDKKQEADDEE
jgi:hypothetical protein